MKSFLHSRSTLALAILLSVGLPSLARAQAGLELTSTRLPDLAGLLLVDQEVKQRDVRRPVGIDSDIYLMRLFELSEIGGCEGTDATCRRHYALVIATGGMPGDASLYDLGSVGEITEIAWVSSPPRRVVTDNPRTLSYSAEATVELTVQNYPSVILKEDRSLVRATRRYRLVVNDQSVTVERIQ